MDAENEPTNDPTPHRIPRIRRRAALGAAAWSAPVIAVVTAAPAMAAASGTYVLTKTSPTGNFTADQSSATQALSVMLTVNGAPANGATVNFTSSDTSGYLTFSPASPTTGTDGIAVTSLVYGLNKPPSGSVFTVTAASADQPTVSTTWTLTFTMTSSVMVVRVGDGSAALTSVATAVFLDEYGQSGGTRLSATALPTAVSGGNNPLTQSGSAASEGALALSADRKFLTLVGYSGTPGTAGIAGTTSAAVPRVIGRVDKSKNIDTTTAPNDLDSTDNPRGVSTATGSSFYTAGNSGGTKRYLLGGSSASSTISTLVANQREVRVAGSDVYFLAASATVGGVYMYSGLPTAAATPTQIVMLNSTGLGGFALISRAGTATPDLMYIIDTAGLYKFARTGTTWTQSGTGPATAVKGTHITGFANSDGTATLFVCNATTVFAVQDSSTSNAAAPIVGGSQTPVVSAATNTTLRGVAFAPDA